MIDKAVLDEILPVPELSELAADTVEELKAEGFVITNFQPGGIFYTLLMAVFRIRIECRQLARNVLNQMFLSHATGIWLDLKLADYSKTRKAAQKTQGLVTVSRTQSGEAIRIGKGQVFKTEKDINGAELRFFVTETTVLQKGALSVDVPVEAESEGARYNVPEGQITKSLVYISGIDSVRNGEDWITREGSDTENDESARARGLRAWSELAQRSIEDSFVNAAEAVPGVLYAQADCQHPRGQGTVDVIVTGTAGTATEGLLAAVREAVAVITGPYDNVLVKSSVTVNQNVTLTITVGDATAEEEIRSRAAAILTDLLTIRSGGRKLNTLILSDINHAIRDGISAATNVQITEPAVDVVLSKDQVIRLGTVSVTVKREA